MWESMNRVEEIIATTKLNELLNKKEEEKQAKTVLWVLAIIGAVAADLLYSDHSLHRIIWKTSKKISKMILTMTFLMTKTKYKNIVRIS